MEKTLNFQQTLTGSLKMEGDDLQKLQERIQELEKQLKKQKETAERGAELVRFMWGDRFETETLF